MSTMIDKVSYKKFKPLILPSKRIAQYLYVHLNCEYLEHTPLYFSRSLVCVEYLRDTEILHTFLNHLNYQRFLNSRKKYSKYVWLRVPMNQYDIPRILK